jgi:chromosome segregation ATPase
LVEIIAKKACSITFESLIDKQNEAIKSLNKELESIQKDEDKHHKNIGKYERDINLSKDKIENNKINLSSQDLLINKNNELLKNKEREIASKNVKSMTSNIKELEKSNKSLNKSIEKHQQKIAEINGQIAMDQSALKGNEAEINTLKNTINVDKEGRKILKKLNKENLKYIGSIETYKVSITDEENKIKELEIQKLNHQTEINNIKNNISIHNEDALINQLKLIEKEAKTLLATKKDIEKDIEKEYRSINQNSENIRLSKKEIEILKEKQITMKESISKSEMEFKELELQKKKFD